MGIHFDGNVKQRTLLDPEQVVVKNTMDNKAHALVASVRSFVRDDSAARLVVLHVKNNGATARTNCHRRQ